MKKIICFIISLFILAIVTSITFAQSSSDKPVFNPITANQSLDAIQKKMDARTDNASVAFYMQQLELLQTDAKKCVSDSESHLKMINELLKSTEIDHVSQLQRADSQYLQGKQLYYAKQLSECRLFVYRSQEALFTYKDLMQKLNASQILKRSQPEWSEHTYYTVGFIAVIGMIFFGWYRSQRAAKLPRVILYLFAIVVTGVLITLIVMEFLGYHRLALFVLMAMFLTIIATTVFSAVWYFVNRAYEWIDNKQYATARKVHQLFGVKFNKKMHEIGLIKFAVHFTLLCLYAIALMKIWYVSSNFIDSVDDNLLHGFKFSGLTIIPARIVCALLSFSIVFLIGRFVATTIAKKHRFKGEEDTQIAVSTITIYVSFAIALLFAMMVTGVDFTGLAIIAGALSVGVGLGLQTIVNNFVSGLILLIEKPIKPGDRIVIGKTEGFVKKIRIRSTQIATLAKEDVIVPNADLITQQVTNFMFRDRNSRVTCQVGVAYGSDVDLVKKLLLEVADKHEEVVHETPNEPIVLFSRFGESSLIFDLWCVIHDVNKKYVVVSDLNFAINTAFKQHKITIAYPQREIHIIAPPT